MDIGKVLGGAWKITWRWKVLWVLGFLASLGQGTPTTVNYTFSGDEFNDYRLPWFETNLDEVVATIISLIALFICILLIIAIILWVISVIARGGLIAAVQQIEEEGSTSFRKAWVAGRRKFWTLFGLGFLVAIPILVMGFILLAMIGIGIAFGVSVMDASEAAGVTSIVFSVLVCGGLLCCGLVVVSLVLEQIRIYAERAAILEDLAWIDAFKRGWQVLKENLGNTILLWLIFFAIGLIVFMISIPILFAIAIPMLAWLALIDPGAWLFLPICIGMLITVIIFALLRSLVMVFSSSTWTLAYREMTAE